MEYKLSNFEGPLDLLLHLISKAKIEPKDIFVSEITTQYLSMMKNVDELDMDSASDFLQMAATLIYIKSRSLLPVKRRDDDLDDDGLTPEEHLIVQLNEYKRYKEASEQLRMFEEGGQLDYYKLPEEIVDSPGEEMGFVEDVKLLTEAYRQALERVREQKTVPPDVVITKDGFSIRKQIKTVMARLALVDEADFFELISENPSREEVAVTFLALLELLHMGKIHVEQKKACGNIFIKRTGKIKSEIDLPESEDDQ